MFFLNLVELLLCGLVLALAVDFELGLVEYLEI